MKTAELKNAMLNYWTARACGISADRLEIRIPECDPAGRGAACWVLTPRAPASVASYCTEWRQGGPLQEEHLFDVIRAIGGGWVAGPPGVEAWWQSGETVLEAICRATVRLAFGEDVDDVEARNANR
jgi:hypothetical protein